MKMTDFAKLLLILLGGIAVSAMVVACGGSNSTGTSTSTSSSSGSTSSSGSSGSSSTSGTSLKAAYQAAAWGSNMTVTFPSDCAMTVVTNGLPNHSTPAYYLRPATGSYTTVVATTPDGLALTVQPNPDAADPTTTTYNICPTKAASPTTTNMGTIGVMISGAALFNAYDGTGDPAMAENVSYTFTDSNNVSQTASFIDSCNGHYTPANAGNTYHYHGVSSCVTAEVDKANGPSHIIGVALDGFPVYGGRDINGNVITVSQLDSCNGITSATPEFPNGIYHYVLPESVTTGHSSLECYSGTVSSSLIAQVTSYGVCVSPKKSRLQGVAGLKLASTGVNQSRRSGKARVG